LTIHESARSTAVSLFVNERLAASGSSPVRKTGQAPWPGRLLAGLPRVRATQKVARGAVIPKGTCTSKGCVALGQRSRKVKSSAPVSSQPTFRHPRRSAA